MNWIQISLGAYK